MLVTLSHAANILILNSIFRVYILYPLFCDINWDISSLAHFYTWQISLRSPHQWAAWKRDLHPTILPNCPAWEGSFYQIIPPECLKASTLWQSIMIEQIYKQKIYKQPASSKNSTWHALMIVHSTTHKQKNKHCHPSVLPKSSMLVQFPFPHLKYLPLCFPRLRYFTTYWFCFLLQPPLHNNRNTASVFPNQYWIHNPRTQLWLRPRLVGIQPYRCHAILWEKKWCFMLFVIYLLSE